MLIRLQENASSAHKNGTKKFSQCNYAKQYGFGLCRIGLGIRFPLPWLISQVRV